jgi:hypothetical protein
MISSNYDLKQAQLMEFKKFKKLNQTALNWIIFKKLN